MDDGGPTASIIIFSLFILLEMFFYGFGAAISALNIKEVEKKAEEDKDKKSIRLRTIIGDPTDYVNTVQMVVTFSTVVIGAFCFEICLHVMESFLHDIFYELIQLKSISEGVITGVSIVLTMILLLYIMLTFGVLLPKRIAGRFPEKLAYACVTPMYAMTVVMKPFTGAITATVRAIMFVLGWGNSENEADVTEEEIINMVNEGHEQGVIEASEAEMISNIFEYGDKEAQNIMTNRKNIIAIDGEMPLKDAIEVMITESNSRYPVYEENIDHIIGVLHLKDAMRAMTDESNCDLAVKDCVGLMREASFVPQTKHIDELFKEMRADKVQMVIVVDEYGQTDGLVAMEDILEEIVGNIMDEYDEEQEYIEEKGEDEYIMEGKTPLEELEERFGIDFTNEEFETLNGFIIARLDHIPEQDEQFDVDYQGYNFRVLSVENKMIQSVLLTKNTIEEVEETSRKEAELDEKDK